MSKWPMRGHFGYLRFKTFPMTPRTFQCEVFWALLLSSKRLGVPEDSKSPTLEVLGFTPTLGQSGVAIIYLCWEPNVKVITFVNLKKDKIPLAIIGFCHTLMAWTFFRCGLLPSKDNTCSKSPSPFGQIHVLCY
jgi:hypothetical protein